MKYRKIDPKIWNDAKFNELSDKGKLLFFFFLTHPHMTPLGAMRGTIPGFAAELGWNQEAFQEAFQEASSKGMVKHDPKAHFMVVPKFVKYNGPESANVVKAWGKCVDDIPECPGKYELLMDVKVFLKAFHEGYVKAFDKALGKAMLNQEQEQEQEQEKEGIGGEKTSPTPHLENDHDTTPAEEEKPDPPIIVSVNNCPQKEIISLYHEILPTLPRVRVWESRHEAILRSRWKSHAEYQTLGWWEDFFKFISTSDFLTGKTGKPFFPDLEWLVTKSSFEKILNGRYENRGATARSHAGIDEWLDIRQNRTQQEVLQA